MRITSASSGKIAKQRPINWRISGRNSVNFKLMRAFYTSIVSFLLLFAPISNSSAQVAAGKKHTASDLIDLVGVPLLPLPRAEPARATPAPSIKPDDVDRESTGSVPVGRRPPSGPGLKSPVRILLPQSGASRAAPAPKPTSDAAPLSTSRQPTFSARTPDQQTLEHLQASLSAPAGQPAPRSIHLEVAAPLPPPRPSDTIPSTLAAGALSPPGSAHAGVSGVTSVAAIGPVGPHILPRPSAVRTTVLPRPSPPISQPVDVPSAPEAAATVPPSPTPAAPPPVATTASVSKAPVLAAAAPAAVVQTADVAPAEPVAEPIARRRRIPSESEEQDLPPRKLSSEWELPRAPRRTARPALNATGVSAPALPTTRIAYVVRAQPLDQLVREIGQIAGVRVVAGPGLRGSVRERRLEGPFNAVLDRLARDFNLFWFSDGGTVYVDPLDEYKTKFFKVRGTTPAHLEQALESAGLARHRDRIQLTGSDGLVRASGSDNFLRVVEAALTGAAGQDTGTVQLIKFGQRVQ